VAQLLYNYTYMSSLPLPLFTYCGGLTEITEVMGKQVVRSCL